MRIRAAFIALAAILPAEAATVPEQHAQANGVRFCMSTIEKISQFILRDDAHAAASTWHAQKPDGRLFTSFAAKKYDDGDTHIVIAVGPNASGNCDGFYTEATWLEKNCTVVREEMFKGFNYRTSMNGHTLALANENGTVEIYLSPQGTGASCLVTRTETVFGE